MNLDTAIAARRAVRQFTDETMDRPTIQRLIEAAVLAPSAVNEQPWLFTVVRDRALLARISTDAKAHARATLAAGLPAHLHDHLAQTDFDILYHAPALIVISASQPGRWAVEDCALAAENLMLAACAAGLGTCWIGFAQTWLGTPAGKEALGLPASCLPVAPIILGHPANPVAPVARRPADIRWIG